MKYVKWHNNNLMPASECLLVCVCVCLYAELSPFSGMRLQFDVLYMCMCAVRVLVVLRFVENVNMQLRWHTYILKRLKEQALCKNIIIMRLACKKNYEKSKKKNL